MTAERAPKQPSTSRHEHGLDELSAHPLNQPEANDWRSGPLELALDLIDEDPHQPRTEDNPGFSAESLDDLAATIGRRGVKTPISVRRHPDKPGRFIINHGARRVRASKLAAKTMVPAFIDNDYSEADQVIENLQRNELTAREIADFIGRELAKGRKKKEIADSIGKSPAFVTQHVTLLDLPEPIAAAYNSGRTRDVTVINKLVAAHNKDPDAVLAWLSDESQELTRGSVNLLREFLDDKREHEMADAGFDLDMVEASAARADAGEDDAGAGTRAADPNKLKRTIVQVRHDGRFARLLLNRRPPASDSAWLRYEDDGHEFTAELSQVQLVALVEG